MAVMKRYNGASWDRLNGSGAGQPADPTLTALAALDTASGLVEQTGTDTFTKRALGVAGATSVPTRADGDARYQAKDDTLTALAGLSTTAGLVEQTGTDTFTKRLIGAANATDVPTRSDTDARQVQPKGLYLPDPTTADTKIVMFYADVAMTIANIAAVLPGGSASPSVTFNIRFGSDVSAAGTAAITGGATVTSVTSGLSTTSFNNANISSGNWVWLEVTAKSGTVPVLSVSVTVRRT